MYKQCYCRTRTAVWWGSSFCPQRCGVLKDPYRLRGLEGKKVICLFMALENMVAQYGDLHEGDQLTM